MSWARSYAIPPVPREPVYVLARSVLIPLLHAWFRWDIEGLENIPPRGPALLAFNHISYLDPLAIAYVVDRARRRPRFLTKSELFTDKRIAWALRGCGQIEVQRGTRRASSALANALDALRRGEVVVIFPEGTVTTNPDLSPMAPRSGVTRLALAGGVPVVPGAIWGTQNIWPKGFRSHWAPRQPLAVRVGKPLPITGSLDAPHEWVAAGHRLMDEIESLAAPLRPRIADRRRPRRVAAG
jgi:1-acyl-sn-glycerol-3-phosphate acyltransferase